MSAFGDRLRWRLDGVMDLAEPVVSRLEQHFRILDQWNQRINLTAIRDWEEAVDRHYAEALFLGSRLSVSTGSLVDIGSGAGFPGTPISILRPDVNVTLVESHSRKAVFLRESTRDLANVSVETRRIEALSAKFDCAVMRAVAWRDVRRVLPMVAHSVGFLLSLPDAEEAAEGLTGFSFESAPLPWDPARVVLLGRGPGQG